MKAKLFIIAMLLSGGVYGQKLLLDKPEVYVPDTVTTKGILKLIHTSSDIYVPVLVEYMLHKAYLDYCYADSVNIGFEYRYNIVESDRGGSYSLIEVYYYYYADRLPTAEINSLCTDYYGPEGDPVGTWRWYHDWYRRKHPQYYQYIPLEYTKVIPIREPSKLPTFKGYVEWLDKLLTK